MILSPRVCSSTVADTLAPGTVGAPRVRPPASEPTASTSWKVTVAPVSASSLSTFSTLLGVTRYCLPPVRITAKFIVVGPEWWCQGPPSGRRAPRGWNGGGTATPDRRRREALAVEPGGINGWPDGRQPRRCAAPNALLSRGPAAERCRSGRTGRSQIGRAHV